MPEKMPHDIRPRDTKGTRSVLVDHELSGDPPLRWLSAPLASGAPRESLERTLRQHRAIYEALRARDGDLAADRVAAHIESAWTERRHHRFS